MIRSIIIKKSKGNSTSLIISQLFLFVLLIWCLFNYRLIMLNATFNYIDDSLVGSLLGSALVNVEEYGKSNQLIIHNGDHYVNKSGNESTNGWEPWEAEILVSELNYGSDITLSPTDLEPKKVLDENSWQSSTKNKDSTELKHFSLDDYYTRSLSAFIGNLNYNLSNGLYNSNINVDNNLSNVQADVAIANVDSPVGPMVINKSALGKSFLGAYIDGDILISRFEIYNIYRANLAEKHVYHSEYMDYTVNGASQDTPDNSATAVTWDLEEPDTEDEFKNKYMPCEYLLRDGYVRTIGNNPFSNPSANYKKDNNGNYIENENYAAEMEIYQRDKKRWEKDLAYYKSGKSLIMYTNTETTYLGQYNPDKVGFKYFFSSGNDFNPIHWNSTTSTARAITNKELAPIVRWTKYSFTPSTGGTITPHNCTSDGSASTYEIKIEGGKLDGVKIKNTAVYVELTFKVKTFPIMTGIGLNSTEGASQTVTVARLIDIETNADMETNTN